MMVEAAGYGQEEVFNVLVEHGAFNGLDRIHERELVNKTIKGNNFEICQTLEEHGILNSDNFRDDSRLTTNALVYTPIFDFPFSQDNALLCGLLIKYIDLDYNEYLVRAICGNKLNCFYLLAPGSTNHETAFQLAARHGRDEMCQWYIANSYIDK